MMSKEEKMTMMMKMTIKTTVAMLLIVKMKLKMRIETMMTYQHVEFDLCSSFDSLDNMKSRGFVQYMDTIAFDPTQSEGAYVGKLG